MLDHVCALLAAAGTPGSVLPPTLLYNEGWMLRLVLDWFAARPRDSADPHPLASLRSACWYTEALLRSPFLPRFRGDPLAEAFTHADAAVGHFKIGTATAVAGGAPGARRAPGSRDDLAADACLFAKISQSCARIGATRVRHSVERRSAPLPG